MTTQKTTTSAARENGQSTQPNYRIYDRTGGGVTHDIHADSLEDAIEQGREWIEDGDWSSDHDSRDGERQYRTVKLDCRVGEIVYYPTPDASGKAIAPAGTDMAGTPLHVDDDGDLVDAEGNIYCAAADAGEIDEDATNDADTHDCSGQYADEEPECEADEDGEHDWKSDYEVVGGIRENPGVWSTGGTSFHFATYCAKCGCYRDERDPGVQRNCDEAISTVTIKERDERSEAWLKEQHAEDGILPEWLAELLGCDREIIVQEAE